MKRNHYLELLPIDDCLIDPCITMKEHHFCVCERTLHQKQKEGNQLGTHNTCSDDILVNDIGIGPIKLLLLSRLSLHGIRRECVKIQGHLRDISLVKIVSIYTKARLCYNTESSLVRRNARKMEYLKR